MADSLASSQPQNSLIKESVGDRIFLVCVYIFVTLALIVTLYPLIYILSASMSDPAAVRTGRMVLWPVDVTLQGYRVILQNSSLWRGYYNTIIYTVVGTSINLLLTIPAGYVLSRDDFQLKGFVTKMMVITMFISGGMIPTYILVNNLGITNTMWALVLPGAASVYNIVITRVFMSTTIPDELTEAAVMDGANNFKIFTAVVLPLSKPIIAVMALFYGIGHWNNFFNALLYLDDRSLYPLQMVLREILVLQDLASNPDVISEEQALYAHSQQQLAAVMKYGVMVVATAPVIMVYPFLQKYFVKGVMLGSIKG
ncbi:sugar ABC transporter permease [Dolosigranulum pigrum]|jgi:sugar ABC transporter permease|uniref:Carbohydrate ABC transporter permease n=1 Tax=Dolosigranulum pigrum TaxID=29394 RepID=A0A328K957_9LACT|nr:carbohydrate ABC transporter permease [Dolosigranulum pigrum]QDO91789.1 carbohydrate ABC transporter permease [Dolosigranulum pigrum]QJS96105.1 carbohydrate ABC transporter permease [Dolosigranulum pigrum]QTJ33342.1 carbohydrate ABC transporter permease [Dolosigranulum pigrum]QTJ35001.1 carbohydrate ABC transporter permease [Dolosigranulum pigrum]QTJ40164.1 carbohydrate ABC transporter permease [Dolosigranulum pigrum]